MEDSIQYLQNSFTKHSGFLFRRIMAHFEVCDMVNKNCLEE